MGLVIDIPLGRRVLQNARELVDEVSEARAIAFVAGYVTSDGGVRATHSAYTSEQVERLWEVSQWMADRLRAELGPIWYAEDRCWSTGPAEQCSGITDEAGMRRIEGGGQTTVADPPALLLVT